MRLSILLAISMAACSGPNEQPPSPPVKCEELQLEWGRTVNGAFAPFRDGENAEIVLGFQGFRFVDSVARLRGAHTKEIAFTLQVTLGTNEPSVQDAGKFYGQTGADGALYVTSLFLFFNDQPMPDLLGREAAVRVRATAAGCNATSTARVTLIRGGCMNEKGEMVPCTAL